MSRVFPPSPVPPCGARLVNRRILVVCVAAVLLIGPSHRAAATAAPQAADDGGRTVATSLSRTTGSWPEADGPVAYIAPIVAPVIDPFRPPTSPYGPGNRGIEYATVPGSPVVAAADGYVSFAGLVAGSLHVTVQHPDGVRVTASFLATAVVVAGAPVVQGQVIGTTADRLHVSARRGAVYFDPASLWAGGPPHVYLVPLDGGGPIPSHAGRTGLDGASRWGTGRLSGYARTSALQHRRDRTTTLTRVHPRSPPAPDPGFVEP